MNKASTQSRFQRSPTGRYAIIWDGSEDAGSRNPFTELNECVEVWIDYAHPGQRDRRIIPWEELGYRPSRVVPDEK